MGDGTGQHPPHALAIAAEICSRKSTTVATCSLLQSVIHESRWQSVGVIMAAQNSKGLRSRSLNGIYLPSLQTTADKDIGQYTILIINEPRQYYSRVAPYSSGSNLSCPLVLSVGASVNPASDRSPSCLL